MIGCHADELPQHQDHPVWGRAARYVATLAADIFLVASVETVVGGGLAGREGFVEEINREFLKLVENYIEIPEQKRPFVVRAKLNDTNGILGAALLSTVEHKD